MIATEQDDPNVLRQRLAEAEEMLRAIRAGEVDAIVVDGQGSPAVYTLKTAADPYRQIVEQMSEGALTVSPDGIILYSNAAFAEMLHMPRQRLAGTPLRHLIIGSGQERISSLLSAAGGSLEVQFRTTGRAIVYAHISAAPLSLEDTPIHCLVVTNLNRQELRVIHDTIVKATAEAIYVIGLDGTIESWNPAAERLYGYAADEAIGRNVRMLIPAEKQAETQFLLLRMSTGSVEKLETVQTTKAGTPIDVSVSWAPIRNSQGDVSAIVANSRDITERKKNEDQIRLLMNEVNHRAKNLLTVVQTIARQTAKGDPKFIAERLNERIAALAASHDLLMQSNWEGVELADLVSRQLQPWAAHVGTRIVAEGFAVRLKSGAAQTLGMALYELATNAAKYGALANEAGSVRVSWTVEGTNFKMRWAEEGGPPTKLPSHQGFGHTVTVRAVEHSLEGKVLLEYASSGVVWELVAPADHVVETK